MSSDPGLGDVVGTISRRLLVNSWVDPDEVIPLLPTGLRPHLGDNGGVIAGCCMIEIEGVRPWPMPRSAGVAVRAVAHRISVEVGPVGRPTLAVFVPVRHTNSFPAIAAGGRVFPGVHERARIGVVADDDTVTWDVRNIDPHDDRHAISASASLVGDASTSSEVGDVVISTTLGVSPGRRRHALETVEMSTASQAAQVVDLDEVHSSFLSGFESAVPAETLLMAQIGVTWRRAQLPT